MRTRTLAAAAVSLLLLASAPAQSQPAPAADKPAATVAGAEPTQHTVTRDKDTLSVDFPDEDIKTILRNVADLFELNIVVPDTLSGKTSIKLRDVTWRQIFDTVLSPVNYTYTEEGNIIKIVSRDTLQMEPVTTEVFILNNAKAADIKPTVDGLVDAATGGKILIDARSNALVITTQPSRITRVRAIIEKLDKATDQVMIESKFVEVSDGDIRDLGLNWKNLAGYSVNAQPTDTILRGGGTVPRTDRNGGEGVVSIPGELIPQVANASTVYSTVLSASQFSVVLSALSTKTNTKIVSNPTIVTLNNTEAFINIGQEYPIPSYTYNSERGTFEVSGFQYKPIGVIMKVTPQVNAQGTIRMVIEPEISSTEKETTFGGAGGASIPIISTRKVRTQVSLKSGYTAGIGGLMSYSQKHGGSKVPVLGSVPVLGRLFSSKSVNDVTTNLLIFITAKNIAADGAEPEQIFQQSALEAAGVSPTAAPAAKK